MWGYAAAEYVRSLAEFGSPRELPGAGGWLLARPLPTGDGNDATGCYPLFSCANWGALPGDLANLAGDIVAVSLVADPAAPVSHEELHNCFPDVCYHYKDHYFTYLSRPLTSFVAVNHQRNARQAGRAVHIERLTRPTDHLPAWNAMYAGLVRRHGIEGIARFSPASFAGFMQVPGLLAYAALFSGEIVGMVLWLVAGDIAYYHLAAYSELGYDLKASFALFWQSLEDLAASGITWAALGGGAGTFAASEGLRRFKQGWSTECRPAYFCGRILDQARYARLALQFGSGQENYFPAYRAPHHRKAAA
jgi:hypothetical protein